MSAPDIFKLYKKSYVSVRSSKEQKIPGNQTTTVVLDTVDLISNDFKLNSDNSVSCEKDGIIVINCKAYMMSGHEADNNIILGIKKNETEVGRISERPQGNKTENISTNDIIVDVKAGDKITMIYTNYIDKETVIGHASNKLSQNVLTAFYL